MKEVHLGPHPEKMTDPCVDNSQIIFSKSYSSPNGFSGVVHYDGKSNHRLLFVCLLIWLVGWLGWVGFDYGSPTVDKIKSCIHAGQVACP